MQNIPPPMYEGLLRELLSQEIIHAAWVSCQFHHNLCFIVYTKHIL